MKKMKSKWDKFLHRKKLSLARKGIHGIKAIGLAAPAFKAKGGQIPQKAKKNPREINWAQVDNVSLAIYGVPYRELPDDGVKQDYVMHEYEMKRRSIPLASRLDYRDDVDKDN